MANESLDLAFAGRPCLLGNPDGLDTLTLDYALGGQPFFVPSDTVIVTPAVAESVTLTSSQSTSVVRAPTITESVTLTDHVSVSIVRSVYVPEVFTLSDNGATSITLIPEEDTAAASMYGLDFAFGGQPYFTYGGKDSLGLDYAFSAQPMIMTGQALLGGIQPSIEIISMPQMVPFP